MQQLVVFRILLKIILSLGFALCFGTAIAQGQSANLTIGAASTLPGGTVGVPISFASLAGAQVSGIQWQMDFPSSAVSVATVTAGPAATSAGKTISCQTQSGRLNCILWGNNQIVLANGTIGTLQLTVPVSATPGSVAITPSGVVASDAFGRAIPATGTNGTLVVSAPAITPRVTSLGCSPLSVTAPSLVSCTVTLSAAASSAGLAVALSSSSPSVVVPPSIGVAVGSATAAFQATVGAVSTNQSAVLTAAANGGAATATLSIAPPLFSLTGNVGAGGAGATILLSGAATASTVADGAGNFAFTNLSNGSYTITPSRAATLFNPASRVVLVSGSNVTGVNFSASAQTWNLSGTVGALGSGAVVTLSGASTGSVFADGAGNFSFGGLANGTYTVTPAKSGVAFTPANVTVTVNGGHVGGVTFTGQSLTYSISGTLGATGAGSAVSLTGGVTASTVADGAGNYRFAGLPNGTYTVSPVRSGPSSPVFSPASQTVVISGANLAGINFQAIAGSTWSLSGSLGAGGADATVALTGASTAWTTADSAGNYAFTNLANGTYTVTPTRSGFNFLPASRVVTISGANLGGVDFFAAAQTWSISGTLGPAGAGATVAVAGKLNTLITADASGAFSLNGVPNGTYFLTPSKPGVPFTPTTRTVTLNGANSTGNDFSTSTMSWSISGSLGASGAGATVTASGPASASATADGAGNYSLSGLSNGTYTVAPAMAGRVFSPLSRTVVVNGSSPSGIDFSTQAQTWTISGTLGAVGSGAQVTLSGAASRVVTADGAGNFSFGNLSNGSYSVTPSKVGVLFTPSSRSAVINGANLTGIDFSAQAQTWTISGTLGTLGSGASVALSGSTAASVVADGAGGYSFSGLPNGSYTVTPAKSGVIFTPAARSLTIASASQTGVNFSSELQPTWSISGTAGVPGSGAVVTLTGAANRTAQADLNGNYQFAGLPNGSYSVAISKPGFSFTPASQNVAVNSANLTGVNFSAQANLYNISGTLGSNGQGATVTVSGTVNRVVFADISGAYVVAGVPPGSYTITPTRVSKLTYIFAPLNQTVTVTASHVTGVNFTGTIQTFSSNSFRSREQGGELRLANTASGYLDAACSPGSMASLVGSQLTAGSEEGNGRVLVNGNKVPVLRWTGSRVDFQCPELPPGAELAIVAETADGEPLSEKIETRMQESAPGLFTLGATTWALAQRSLTGEVIGPEGKNGQTEMARAGDFLTLFATGLGAATEPVDAGQEAPLDRLIELRGRVRVVLGGTAIEPVFAGLAPGTIGLYQINFVVPAEAPRGPDVALHVEVWGVAGGPAGVSNTVRLPIARDDE